MKIAVSAASSQLGHAVLHELLSLADAGNIVAIARTPAKVDMPGIEKRAGDYTSLESMAEALSGIDTLVIISAPVGDWDRVAMHRNVIRAAERAGVRKVIFTSVVGNAKVQETWFWNTQQPSRQVEDELRASGLQWVVARNGLYLEKDLRHIILASKAGVYRNIAGDGVCGYITIGELACALARLALDDRNNGKVLNLVGEDLTQARLVALANEVYGLNVCYETITDEENIAALMKDEKIAKRGVEVAKMLTGCFQCVRIGAFDVPSGFEQAAGRPVKSTREMMEGLREQFAAELSSVADHA